MNSIRKVELSEVQMVVDLIDEFERVKSPHPSQERMEEIFKELELLVGCVVGAFEGTQLVGTCTVNMCSNLYWSGRLYAMIENVIVSKSFRKIGIGKAILEFAKQYALDKGCYKVALMTGSKKSETLRFYESAGFVGNKIGFQYRSGA